MERGEIYWADLPPPAGRRPIVLLTRTQSIRSLNAIVVAPVTRTIRRIPSEVRLGTAEGMRDVCVANCDNLMSVPKASIDARASGRLAKEQTRELDEALVYTLGIRFWPT